MRFTIVIMSCFMGALSGCGQYEPTSSVAGIPAPVLADRVTSEELARIEAGEEIVSEFANYDGKNSNQGLMNLLSGPLFSGANNMPRYTSGFIYKGMINIKSDSSTTTRLISTMENVSMMAKARLPDGKEIYSYTKAIDSNGNVIGYGANPQDDATLTDTPEERVILSKLPRAMTSEFKMMARMVALNGVLVTSNYIITTPASIAMDGGNLRNYIELHPYNPKSSEPHPVTFRSRPIVPFWTTHRLIFRPKFCFPIRFSISVPPFIAF